MNIDYQIKKILENCKRPISDFKLIKDYQHNKNLSDQEIIYFVNEYCENDYPLQYKVGHEYFFTRKINVNENVLIPRMETEEVVLAFVNEINDKYELGSKIKLLDLCCGSGAILIGVDELIGNKYDVEYYASDISKEALEVATNNFYQYNMKVKVIQSDMLEYFVKNNYKFDCFISNPPYIPHDGEVQDNVVKYEPNLALFAAEEGLYFYYKIIHQLDKVLNEKAIVCFEIGIGQGQMIINKVINNIKFKKNDIICDINSVERIILLSR